MSTPPLPLDASDLALFAQVVESGSFTVAAQALGWPKSTLSRRLTALEARLGERLLQRTTRRLSLTDFGQAVLEHAREVVAQTAATQALAQHRQLEPSGPLRVSMVADVAQLVLAPALARFVQRYPKVTLELDLSPRRVDLVAEHYDLALRVGALGDEASLHARRLAWLQGGLYAAPDWLDARAPLTHPRELEAAGGPLRALVLGAPGRIPRPWSLSRRDPAGGMEVWTGLPADRTTANLPALLLEMAATGLGVTATADLLAEPLVRSGRLRRVLPDWAAPPEPLWAVFPDRRLMPAKTRALLELLAEALAPCEDAAARPA